MDSSPEPHYFRHWIFQAMPGQYDLEKELVPEATDQWPLSRYGKQIKAGDVVYFWRGGRQSGLYGWGMVAGEPYERRATKGATGDKYVDITYQYRFRTPIGKELLTSGSHAINLAGLLILRSPEGTCFKVTTQEAISLNRLIWDHSEKAPQDPIGIETGHLPALSLTPLAFNIVVAQIVGGAIRLAAERLQEPAQGQLLVDVLIAAAHVSQEKIPKTVTLFWERFAQIDMDEAAITAFQNPVPTNQLTDHAISGEILNIMESARLLAIHSTRKEEITLRHFLGAILLSGSDRTLEYLDRVSSRVDLDLEGLPGPFLEYVETTFPEDEKSLWSRRFRDAVNERIGALSWPLMDEEEDQETSDSQIDIETDISKAALDSERPEMVLPEVEVSGVLRALARAFSGLPIPDRPFGTDLLRIESEVAALAHLFASCKEDSSEQGDARRPTFALGLFGRWGTGKSFFIEKLKQQISDLKNSESPDYYKNIVQIDFNAWHYNEADIWASLVHHIFETLQKRFQEHEFRNLIEKLEISKERREQINRRIRNKQDEKCTLEEHISLREEEIEGFIEEQVANIGALEGFEHMNKAMCSDLLELLPQAAELLGFDKKMMAMVDKQGKQQAAELLTLAKQTTTIINSGPALGRALLYSGFSRFFLGCAAGVLVLYCGLPFLLKKPDIWDQFLGQTAQVIALVSPAVIWLKSRWEKAVNIFDRLKSVEIDLRTNLEAEQKEKDKALKKLSTDQNQLSAELKRLSNRKKALDAEIEDLNHQLEEMGTTQSLVDFINERAASDDYRSKLGILALIRRDFETLSNLLTRPQPSADCAIESQQKLPEIDRIILYIDDLDRVQESKKVLQVLEAVHLLLALPLFHVVVAVDERWATRSILSHHSDFFETSLGNHKKSDADQTDKTSSLSILQMEKQPATPREYLEKIFQISFWVRPLSEQMAQMLIQGVVTQKGLSTLEQNPETENPEHPDNADTRANDDTTDEAIGSQTAPQITASDQTKVEDTSPGELLENNTIEKAAGSTTISSQTVIPSAVNTNPGTNKNKSATIHFDITSNELITMKALANVIRRSPRTVKRFINTYRLFKAMKIPGESADWNDPESNPEQIESKHVPIMILLAIQVGYPDLAVRIFEALDQALEKDDNQHLGDVLNLMATQTMADASETAKWRRAIGTLIEVNELYHNPPALRDLNIGLLNDWLQPTSRFGFQEFKPKSGGSQTRSDQKTNHSIEETIYSANQI